MLKAWAAVLWAQPQSDSLRPSELQASIHVPLSTEFSRQKYRSGLPCWRPSENKGDHDGGSYLSTDCSDINVQCSLNEVCPPSTVTVEQGAFPRVMAAVGGLGCQLLPRSFPSCCSEQRCGGEPRGGYSKSADSLQDGAKQVKGRTVEAVWETGGNNEKFIWLKVGLSQHRSCPSCLVWEDSPRSA